MLDAGASGAGAVQTMYNLLDSASTHLNGPNGAWNLILDALAQGTLGASTQGVAAEKNIKTGLGWIFPASQDMLAILQAGGTSITKVKSHVKVGLQKIELAIAQVAGFKSNSHGKLEKALDFSIIP